MLTVFRDAWRGLRSGKTSTFLAFGILALAIGAGTVTFSVVDAIALRPLPYASPDRLVAIGTVQPTPGLNRSATQDYFAWRDRIDALEGLAAYRGNIGVPLSTQGGKSDLSVARVTANFFDVLAARPAIGRLFGPEHDIAGGDDVIVLSHALWKRSFGADTNVIGRTVVLQDQTRVIIGVLPAEMTYPIGWEHPTDAYIPSVATADERDERSTSRSYRTEVIGRLKPAASLLQAQAQLDAVDAARIAYGSAIGKHLILPLNDRIIGPAKSWLLLVLAGVGCVLLIACANVASLLLARATVRARELATREVLGASRGQITSTLICEGLLIAVASGVAGIMIASWGIGIAKASLPTGLARASTIALDTRVFIASIAATLLCGLTFASAPAWLRSRTDVYTATRSGSGAVIGGRGRGRSLGAFLVAEMAFVTALLVATTMAVTSFVLITTADLGFDRHDLLAINVNKSLEKLPAADRPAAAATFRADLVEQVRRLPGVVDAALIRRGVPLVGGSASGVPVDIPGRKGAITAGAREVTPSYFSTMNLRVVLGRALEPSDSRTAPRVVVISDTMATRYFADVDPIGQVIRVSGPATVVGVVRGVYMYGPEAAVSPEVYLAMDQGPTSSYLGLELVVRTATVTPALGQSIRQTAVALSAEDDVFQPRGLDDAFRFLTADRRFNAGLMSIFGVIALVIGAIGIYGTTAFVVAQDVRAIGLRMALGATPARVRRSVLRTAAARVVIGVVAGLVVAWASSSVFSALVFGVTPTSPAVYAGVAMLLSAVGVLAALVPAIRASRLDPLVALRAE